MEVCEAKGWWHGGRGWAGTRSSGFSDPALVSWLFDCVFSLVARVVSINFFSVSVSVLIVFWFILVSFFWGWHSKVCLLIFLYCFALSYHPSLHSFHTMPRPSIHSPIRKANAQLLSGVLLSSSSSMASSNTRSRLLLLPSFDWLLSALHPAVQVLHIGGLGAATQRLSGKPRFRDPKLVVPNPGQMRSDEKKDEKEKMKLKAQSMRG